MDGSSLTGRRMLVTGASSGIGEAVVETLVKGGASVGMVARRRDRLEALHERLGDAALPLIADVADESAMVEAGARAADTFGGLDGVVANAGVTHIGSISDGDPSIWRRVLETNLLGALVSVRAALPHFSDSGQRDVVIVSSTGGLTPIAGIGVYAATKAGVNMAAQSLRLELVPRGIRVCLLAPGDVATEAGVHALIEDRGALGAIDRGQFERLAAAEVADVVAFVLSRPEGVCLNKVVVRPLGQLIP